MSVTVSTPEPTVAVMMAVPASNEVRVATAIPLVVGLVVVSLPTSPKLVVKVTTVPSSTGFPN